MRRRGDARAGLSGRRETLGFAPREAIDRKRRPAVPRFAVLSRVRSASAMSRWFRLYADAMRNPKVAKLGDKDFRLWVELLAVASENEGEIPCLDDLKHLLRRRLDHLSTAVQRLISVGLIDVLEGGYVPHSWAKFQYKSDTSTERVHKHREKRNVSVTPPDTETDTETDKKGVVNTTPRTRRAARIGVDWKPSLLPANVLALFERWPKERAEREQAGFVDYWLARQRDAARADWDKVWHNRIRDIHDRVLRESNNGRPHTQQRVSGIAGALDRRLGLGEPAGEVERYSTRGGSADSQRALALIAPVQR